MKQITIPIESRPGELARITRLLADADVNIQSLDTMEDEEQGILVLTVDRYDTALRLLRDAGYQAVTEDAIVIRVIDEPGALARVASRLAEAGVNVRSLHILRRRKGKPSLVSLVTDDNEAASKQVEDLLAK